MSTQSGEGGSPRRVCKATPERGMPRTLEPHGRRGASRDGAPGGGRGAASRAPLGIQLRRPCCCQRVAVRDGVGAGAKARPARCRRLLRGLRRHPPAVRCGGSRARRDRRSLRGHAPRPRRCRRSGSRHPALTAPVRRAVAGRRGDHLRAGLADRRCLRCGRPGAGAPDHVGSAAGRGAPDGADRRDAGYRWHAGLRLGRSDRRRRSAAGSDLGRAAAGGGT